jgi:hypothetical protein
LSPAREPANTEELFARILQAGEDVRLVREFLASSQLETNTLLGLLRRSVPVSFLMVLGTEPPWSEDIRVLGGVVLNPRTPLSLSQRVLPQLAWGDLAGVARSPRVSGTVRIRAEGILKDRLPEMRLGDRIALAKIATPRVISLLIGDPDARVVHGCLLNPRLREEDLVSALRRDTVAPALIEAIEGSERWREGYRVRLALVLQPLTPLPIALAHVSSLNPRDLLHVAESPGLAPLIQIAAQRVAEAQAERAVQPRTPRASDR